MTDAVIGLHQGAPEDYRPLNEDEFKLFTEIVFRERQMPVRFMTAGEIEKDFGAQAELTGLVAVFLRRLAAFTPDLKFDIGVTFYVLSACTNPAETVMWAYTLARITQEFGPVRLNDIMLKTPLGDGLPKDGFVRRCWSSQKMSDHRVLDNRLDLPGTWAPLPKEGTTT
jgi:hypothetical protein